MNKPKKEPILINLNEIKDDGESYQYTRASGELNETLEDLVHQYDYSINFNIRSIGDVFEVEGSVSTRLDLTCSRCAYEFNSPLYFKFKELVMIEDTSAYKNGSLSRQNYITHNGESEIYCHMVPSAMFDIAEFLHEQIAINEPLHPTGKANCDDSCENLKEALAKGWIVTDSERAREKAESTHRPFAELSKIKLNP